MPYENLLCSICGTKMGLYNLADGAIGGIEAICNKCANKKIKIKHGEHDNGKFNLKDHTLGHGCWE